MLDAANLDRDLEGPVSPPRDNGEIVFAAPWERRVFGLTIAACRARACGWEDFRERLIARISENEERPYWESWAAALEDVLAGSGALPAAELDARHRVFLARPHGHDH
jgi:nitrile hydratase accessory protein